jgi:uncharacterized protein (TIGR02145 family)
MKKQNAFLVFFLIVMATGILVISCSKPESRSLFSEDEPVTDYDGNTYKTVKIGNQIWMAENLRTTRYNNGESIPEVVTDTDWAKLTTGAYCWYNNDIASCTKSGALYNWFAVHDNRNLAPTGWHIPTDDEWFILEQQLGGRNTAGGRMKSSTTWKSPNTGGDNSSGFAAVPGGFRNGMYGNCDQFDILAYWWTATESDITIMEDKLAWFRIVGYDNTDICRASINEKSGISVRCVKDNN